MTTLTIRYHLPAEANEPQVDEAIATFNHINTASWFELTTRHGYLIARHWATDRLMYIPWHRVISISEAEPRP